MSNLPNAPLIAAIAALDCEQLGRSEYVRRDDVLALVSDLRAKVRQGWHDVCEPYDTDDSRFCETCRFARFALALLDTPSPDDV